VPGLGDGSFPEQELQSRFVDDPVAAGAIPAPMLQTMFFRSRMSPPGRISCICAINKSWQGPREDRRFLPPREGRVYRVALRLRLDDNDLIGLLLAIFSLRLALTMYAFAPHLFAKPSIWLTALSGSSSP
jgi:hypothetical protein